MTPLVPPSAPTDHHGPIASRFELVSRRAFVRGTLAALALAPIGAACGSSDEEVFSDVTSTGDQAADATSSTASSAATTSTVPGTDAAASTAGTAASTAAASGTELPAGAQLVVNFSYAPSESGGRVRNPYVAVWIEDAGGELVATVALWMKAGKSKYLNSLTRWYTVESERLSAGGEDVVDEISSATRVAGAYSVMWDGTTADGGRAAQGDHYVCIEAAREHGPYELIRDVITLGDEAASVTFADNGELSAASAAYTVG